MLNFSVFSLNERMELEADMKAQGLSYALITGIVRIRLSGIEKRVLGRWLRVYRQKSRSAYQFVFPSFIQNELVAFTALLGTLWAYMASASAGISAAQLAAFLSCFTFATAALQKMTIEEERLYVPSSSFLTSRLTKKTTVR